MQDVASSPVAARGAGPRAPLGHLTRLGFALKDAVDVDAIARSVLTDLVGLPGVIRVGIGLSEGGGRRLRFVSTDRAATDLVWCHIDAYDDVPLTTVVRTGDPIMSSVDNLAERFADLVDKLRKGSTVAIAALPLPGTGSPIGALILYFDVSQPYDEAQVLLLEAAARRTSEAVRRVRRISGRVGADSFPPETEIPEGALTSSVLLESDPRASSAGRRFLRQELTAWDIDDDVSDTAQLCLSEIVTNAVVHAGTACELRVMLQEGVLTVIVRDLGGLGRRSPVDVAEPVEDMDPMQVHGRGLMLVDALVDHWGSERDMTGTTVWFSLELDNSQKQTG